MKYEFKIGMFDVEATRHEGEPTNVYLDGHYEMGFDPYYEITKISVNGSEDLHEFLTQETINYIEDKLVEL